MAGIPHRQHGLTSLELRAARSPLNIAKPTSALAHYLANGNASRCNIMEVLIKIGHEGKLQLLILN